VRQSYAATPKRPAGPARRERAFAELLAELEHILDLSTLEASAALLTGGAPPDLSALQEVRLAHRRALDRWAEEALRHGTDATAILTALQADDALRILSYLTVVAGSDAVLAVGGRVDARLHLPAETPRRAGPVGLVARVAATVRAHLTPSSPVLHGSLRVGLGLALAVLLSRLLRLDHGFWVVLATLSVLRTTALATGRTTAQALAGTIGGFALSALFLATVGRDPTVLWLALPCAIFLAAYAASVVGFVAGQAAFSVTVVILFNLIVPAGWQLGLVRVEDVAIGAGISVVVGLLLWPRGARGEFRQALGDLFAGIAAFLGRAFDHALQYGARDDVLRARGRLVRVHARAGEAFDRLLREHAAHAVNPQIAAALVATGAHALVAGDLISGMAVKGYHAPGSAEELADLYVQAHRLAGTFERLATWLHTMHPVEIGPVGPETMLREDVLRLLDDWRSNPQSGHAAITAVTLAEWIQLLGGLVARLGQPVAATVEAARVPWWR
jgi:uncharacterized membrane protein YccC